MAVAWSVTVVALPPVARAEGLGNETIIIPGTTVITALASGNAGSSDTGLFDNSFMAEVAVNDRILK